MFTSSTSTTPYHYHLITYCSHFLYYIHTIFVALFFFFIFLLLLFLLLFALLKKQTRLEWISFFVKMGINDGYWSLKTQTCGSLTLMIMIYSSALNALNVDIFIKWSVTIHEFAVRDRGIWRNIFFTYDCYDIYQPSIEKKKKRYLIFSATKSMLWRRHLFHPSTQIRCAQCTPFRAASRVAANFLNKFYIGSVALHDIWIPNFKFSRGQKSSHNNRLLSCMKRF